MNPKLMRVCEPGDELHDPSGLRLAGAVDGDRGQREAPTRRRRTGGARVGAVGGRGVDAAWASPDGEIRGRLQNTLTIHDLFVSGTFLAGPPRFAQRAVLGAVATLARARGLRAYHRPEIARSTTA